MQLMLAAALVAVAAALGRVAASPAEPMAREAEDSLFVCTDAHFDGNCGYFGITNAQCSVFSPSFQNDISSIQPPSGWVCDAYINYSCSGNGLGYITNPGISDLSATNYNDKLNSFICYST